jgi:hypothetical protein
MAAVWALVGLSTPMAARRATQHLWRRLMPEVHRPPVPWWAQRTPTIETMRLAAATVILVWWKWVRRRKVTMARRRKKRRRKKSSQRTATMTAILSHRTWHEC